MIDQHFKVTIHTYRQQGIGLVEVMVALLLLATVALGYSVLQARSLNAMNETNLRMQSILILNEAAERIRANRFLQDIQVYQSYLSSASAPSFTDCNALGGCTAIQTAKNDVVQLRQSAQPYRIRLDMLTCPGTANFAETKCLVAAWNNTKAGYDSETTAVSNHTALKNDQIIKDRGCFDKAGRYLTDSDCIYIELY